MKTDYTSTMLYNGKVEVKFYGATPDKPNRHLYYVDGKRKTGVTTYIGIKDKSRPLMIWQTEVITDALLTLSKEGKKRLTRDMMVLAVNEPAKVKARAADIGTEAHDWIERYIKSKLDKKLDEPEMPEDENVITAVTGFLQWEKEHHVRFVSSERLLYSKKYDYVGTLDIEALVDGELCLIDIKTSSGLYNDVKMQTSAYVMADEEETGKKYAGRWAIRLSKETEKEAIAKLNRKALIYQILGKKEPTMKPYRPFEAQNLGTSREELKSDFEAFLNARALFNWNKITDMYEKSETNE